MYISNRSWSLIIDRNKIKYPQILLEECMFKPERSLEKVDLIVTIFPIVNLIIKQILTVKLIIK